MEARVITLCYCPENLAKTEHLGCRIWIVGYERVSHAFEGVYVLEIADTVGWHRAQRSSSIRGLVGLVQELLE